MSKEMLRNHYIKDGHQMCHGREEVEEMIVIITARLMNHFFAPVV